MKGGEYEEEFTSSVPASRGVGCAMGKISLDNFDPVAAVSVHGLAKHLVLMIKCQHGLSFSVNDVYQVTTS